MSSCRDTKTFARAAPVRRKIARRGGKTFRGLPGYTAIPGGLPVVGRLAASRRDNRKGVAVDKDRSGGIGKRASGSIKVAVRDTLKD